MKNYKYYLLTVFKLKINKISNEIEFSLNKIENFLSDLQFRNKFVIIKILKCEENLQIMKNKEEILNYLIEDCNIDSKTMESLLNKNNIDENFFKSYEKINKIYEIHDNLSQIEGENNTLKNSVFENLSEIKSIALSRLIKFLNTNIESIESNLLKKSIGLLKKNEEYFGKFLKNFANFRKNQNKNYINALINNFSLIYEKENIRFFTDVLAAIINQIDEEIFFLLGKIF